VPEPYILLTNCNSRTKHERNTKLEKHSEMDPSLAAPLRLAGHEGARRSGMQ